MAAIKPGEIGAVTDAEGTQASAPFSWTLQVNNVTVATNAAPSGWNISYAGSNTGPPFSVNVSLAVPANAAMGGTISFTYSDANVTNAKGSSTVSSSFGASGPSLPGFPIMPPMLDSGPD